MGLKIMQNTESTVEILLSSLLKGFYKNSSRQYKAIVLFLIRLMSFPKRPQKV